MEPIGLYLHIPFCLSKCPYCDFYSLRYTPEAAARYTEALLRAIDRAAERFSPAGQRLEADTVYFGGGTPVLLGAEALSRLLERLSERFSLLPGCEVTLEANPAALRLEELCALRQAGFGRISMGVQAADDRQLRTLGRLHTFQQAVDSMTLCRKAGFENLSVDLMLATPGQTADSISLFAQTFAQLEVPHISGYLLTVEEGTPFARRHIEDQCPDEEQTRLLYLHAVRTLETHGWQQYEISNFARPGFESRHNLRYWDCRPYLGLGPSAYSFLGGERFSFPRDLEGFCAAADPFSLVVSDGRGGDFFEYAMLRLRLAQGLRFADCARRYPQVELTPLLCRSAPLEQHGLVERDGSRLRLTWEGFLLSNAVIVELLQDY